MNVLMSEQRRDRLVSFIKKWAEADGITDGDLGDYSFDIFPSLTKSERILKLCRIAYYRAHGRAVKTAHEMSQPITLRWDSGDDPKSPFTMEIRSELLERMVTLAQDAGVSQQELHNWTLDGFGRLTKSARIMHMVRLAYYRGWCKGIIEVYERLQTESMT